MMTSKEWVIHKRLDDANPIPRITIPRGTAKSKIINAYLKRIANYYSRPIYVENPPIDILKGELINEKDSYSICSRL